MLLGRPLKTLVPHATEAEKRALLYNMAGRVTWAPRQI